MNAWLAATATIMETTLIPTSYLRDLQTIADNADVLNSIIHKLEEKNEKLESDAKTNETKMSMMLVVMAELDTKFRQFKSDAMQRMTGVETQLTTQVKKAAVAVKSMQKTVDKTKTITTSRLDEITKQLESVTKPGANDMQSAKQKLMALKRSMEHHNVELDDVMENMYTRVNSTISNVTLACNHIEFLKKLVKETNDVLSERQVKVFFDKPENKAYKQIIPQLCAQYNDLKEFVSAEKTRNTTLGTKLKCTIKLL